MSCHLYKGHLVVKAPVLAIGWNPEDCDKLNKFGWAATTFLDDQDSQPPSWVCTEVDDLIFDLRSKRIILFPHQTPDARPQEGYLLSKIVDRVIDVRIVRVPCGGTVAGFLATIKRATDASYALQRLIELAIPLTSFENYTTMISIEEIERNITICPDLRHIEEAVHHLSARFRRVQHQESARRAKMVPSRKV